MQEQALLLVALKRLNQQQRLLDYFKQHGVKLLIDFEVRTETIPTSTLKIALNDGIVLYINAYQVEKYRFGYIQMRSSHNGRPTIKREENLVQIEFITSNDILAVLKFFLKDQDSKTARVEMSTNIWSASHEYPLALQPHVNEILEEAIGIFGWEK